MTTLPKLPVPSLQSTCENYLRIIEPLVTPSELQEAKHHVAQFLSSGGDGEFLQNLLIERAKSTINWLEDWWMSAAYLSYRLPVLIHSSPGMTFDAMCDSMGGNRQLRVAARIAFKLRLYWEDAKVDKITPLMLGKQKLDMYQSSRLLGVCRVPAAGIDTLAIHGDEAKEMLIAYRNQFFVVGLYHKSGRPLSMGELECQLARITTSTTTTQYPPVGILTCAHRDTWATVYEHMCRSDLNRLSFARIHRALAIISLDKTSPITPTARINTALHGNGSEVNSANRWMDKSYAITVAENGESGAAIEHTVADGLPFFHMATYTLSYAHILTDEAPGEQLPFPQQLHWELDDTVTQAVQEACISTDQLIRSFEISAFDFAMALQLAYYRDQGEMIATYESGHTLLFAHGRTETIRPISLESVAMATAMDEKPKNISKCAALVKVCRPCNCMYTC